MDLVRLGRFLFASYRGLPSTVGPVRPRMDGTGFELNRQAAYALCKTGSLGIGEGKAKRAFEAVQL